MKNSNTKEKILEVLFDFPTKEFYLRELSRITQISPNSISKAISELKKDNLIITNKTITLNLKANLDNDKFKNLKRVSNLNKIYSSGLFSYLKENFPLSAIILFGSYSKGEDAEKSDIDIAILDIKEKKIELENYEKILNRKVNIDFINMKNITKELRNSVINGIPLQGYIQI